MTYDANVARGGLSVSRGEAAHGIQSKSADPHAAIRREGFSGGYASPVRDP
jgi:hypothetical protein